MKISKSTLKTHLYSTRSCLFLLQCYNESYFQLYFLCSFDKTIPLSLASLFTMQGPKLTFLGTCQLATEFFFKSPYGKMWSPEGVNKLGGGGDYFLTRGYWGRAAGWGRIFTTGLTIMGLHLKQSY